MKFIQLVQKRLLAVKIAAHWVFFKDLPFPPSSPQQSRKMQKASSPHLLFIKDTGLGKVHSISKYIATTSS